MTTRREQLDNVMPAGDTHAGLWLDRFLKQYARTDADAQDAAAKKDTEAKATLVDEVCSIRPPEIYAAWFQRWAEKLEQHASIIGEATTLAPLVVGLGSASVLETSLSLHRTFGVPFIPGSALKGLTAAFTRRRVADWGAWSEGKTHSYEPGEAYTIAFGTQQSAGYVSFYDALWIPGDAPLHREVMTPHHPRYQTGSQAPTDFDSPTPVPFISAAGSFLVALGGPVEWTQRIFEILTVALAEEGVGAKTSSGYGRMRLEQRLNQREEATAQFLRELERFPLNRVPQQLGQFVQRWFEESLTPAGKLRGAQMILQKLRDANYERRVQEKPWYAELITYLDTNA